MSPYGSFTTSICYEILPYTRYIIKQNGDNQETATSHASRAHARINYKQTNNKFSLDGHRLFLWVSTLKQ